MSRTPSSKLSQSSRSSSSVSTSSAGESYVTERFRVATPGSIAERAAGARRGGGASPPRAFALPVAGVLAAGGGVAHAVTLVLEGRLVEGLPAAVLAVVLRRRRRADLEVVGRVV